TLTGSGTAGDPWVATTVLDVPGTSLVLTQTVTYVNGDERIRNGWTLCNCGGSVPYTSLHVFHAADLYTTGDDRGYGYYDGSTGAIGGYNVSRTLYQAFVPINAGNSFEEDFYSTIWADIGDI